MYSEILPFFTRELVFDLVDLIEFEGALGLVTFDAPLGLSRSKSAPVGRLRALLEPRVFGVAFVFADVFASLRAPDIFLTLKPY